ncbi:MAG: insulinase family protein [Pedobacter sp.]|nr:MAG: insulinase family protein [Pedobacter sp.]
MIDRVVAPAFRQVEQIELIHAKPQVLSNGVKTFVIAGGEQDMVRLEFIFNNVSWDAAKPLQAFATHTMLNDGTSEFTATQIAEKVDYYGAFLTTEYGYDQSTVTLLTLSKHLASTLPIVKAIISDSVFPERELQTFITNQKQKLSINLEKNSFLSRRIFNKALFGNTLYGYDAQASDYDRLTQQELKDHFYRTYQPQNCTIIASGQVTDDIIKQIDTHFGKNWNNTTAGITENQFEFKKTKGSDHYVEKPEALQSAIRLGQLSVGRSHPDYAGLQVLGTILGGYFGSRLMANIREDKGYTYGIGSALTSFKNTGCFFIASEVGVAVCQATLDEIKKELIILQQELVPVEELSLVRNYMLGSILGSLENTLSHADKFKNIYFFGLGYDYYDRYINTVKTIASEELLRLAQQYLNFDEMEKVVVGKK